MLNILKTHKQIFTILPLIGLLLSVTNISADDLAVRHQDPHYTKTGFFDLHVCNWPDRSPFFLAVFSTHFFGKLKGVNIYNTDGSLLDSFDKNRFRQIKQKGKAEKRAYIKHIQLSPKATNGWYRAVATLTDGTEVEYRDYVILDRMDWARNTHPKHNAENIPLPKELSWQAVPGARYYQVFIKDLWDSGKVILTSKLLTEPRLKLKPGLIEADGWYEWRIHARDVNEHMLLGDFNNGSLSPIMKFTTAEK